jgi:hypothetical protein
MAAAPARPIIMEGLREPLRIRVERIVDFGTTVSLIGVDTEI